MKRFILRSLLFLIPVLLVLAGWEVLMYNIPSVFSYKRNVVMKNCQERGNALFLGSSHTYYGVNTDTIPDAYNLGFVSQSLSQDRIIFEKFLYRPGNLQYVVIPVSVFSLFKAQKNWEEEWRKLNYIRYWKFPAENITQYFFTLDNVPFQLKYVRKTLRKIRKKGINEALSCSATGWGMDYVKARDYSRFENLGKASATRHCDVYPDDITSFQELQAMIKAAGKHHIKVILFTPPAHKTYYNHVSPQQEKKMRDLLAQVIDGKNVFYLDLLRCPDFIDEDFSDPDHMSHIGAQKLAFKLHTFYKDK